MISLTKAAAEQIRQSAKQSHMEGLPLRLAAKRTVDGSLNYAMGFADEEHDGDMTYSSEGVEIVVSPLSADLLKDTTLDYVQLDNGEFHFIFCNPSDPNYRPANA